MATWLRGKKLYYWSSDATGRTILPDSEQLALGLPNLVFSPSDVYSLSWSVEVYEFIWKWQEVMGYDPRTTEFATSLGFPDLEVFDDEGRFEVSSSGCGKSFPPICAGDASE